MNIQAQCCGVAILLLLLYFFLKQKKLGLLSEKMFLRVVSISFFCLCLDILSIVVIVHHDSLSDLFIHFICKSYLVSLTWMGFFGLIYASMDLHTRNIYHKVIRNSFFFVLTGSVIIYILPIYYYCEKNVVYTYGPSCIMTYIVAIGFVLLTLYRVTVNGKKMNPKRRSAVTLWMIIWIIAAAIQFLNAKLLLVGFATAFGVVILFFELENPEANLDRETGAYNAHALWEYIRQKFETKDTFSLLVITFTELQENETKPEELDAALKEIVQYLGRFKNVKIFKNVERELVLIFQDRNSLEETFTKIQERFCYAWNETNKEVWSILLKPYYIIFPDSSILSGSEEIFRLSKFYKSERYKHPDKDRVYVDEEKIHRVREREETEQMILSAIGEDRIEVYYQPIYSVKEKRFTSAEALARIREKDGTVIMPGKFIPIAEETGLVKQLGEIVFEKVCRFIREKEPRYYGLNYIEVNLSVKQCEEGNFADNYIKIMKEYHIDPSYINLEITETASIQTKQILIENMEKLIKEGVRFSLDDFGNGESNLNYIVDMPISIVKFDRGMSQAYFENKKARFVMDAAMRMIHEMELEIVSEGVETKEQMETIESLEIDYIQGYYFSRPLPTLQFLQFIRQKNRENFPKNHKK